MSAVSLDYWLALMPISSTATQVPLGKHDIDTPAPYPPGNTVEGVDHRPAVHVIASPLSPISEQLDVDGHETAYAAAFW